VVGLQEVGIVQQVNTDNGDIDRVPSLSSIMEIALKNAMMMSNMKTEGKSPTEFYCPYDPNVATQVLGNHLCRAFVQGMVSECWSFGVLYFLSASLTNALSSVRVKSCHMLASTKQFTLSRGTCVRYSRCCIEFFNIDSTPPDSTRQGDPIPILDKRSNKLCGVRVDPSRQINNFTLRGDIEKELRKLILTWNTEREEGKHIIWCGQCLWAMPLKSNPTSLTSHIVYRKKLVEKSLSDEDIEKMIAFRRRGNTKLYRNNRLLKRAETNREPAQQKDPNIWTACGPESLFDIRPRGAAEDAPAERWTVEQYMRERHGVQLRFPHMPMIFLKDGREEGYYPVEFIFQAFSKLKGTGKNARVLKFNDEFASTGGALIISR
jgi:hypothetical protein